MTVPVCLENGASIPVTPFDELDHPDRTVAGLIIHWVACGPERDGVDTLQMCMVLIDICTADEYDRDLIQQLPPRDIVDLFTVSAGGDLV